MKKLVYAMGSIEIILGALTLCATAIIGELLPKIGWMVFAAGGQYSPERYSVQFLVPNIIAIAFIIVGAIQIVLALKMKEQK